MSNKHLFLLTALTSVSLLPLAHAEKNVDDRWYVAPFGSFVRAGGDRNSSDGWGGGLGVGKMIDEHFNVELKGFYQNLDGYNNKIKGLTGDWDLAGGLAEAQYYLFRDQFSPYVVAGIGGMNTSVSGDSGVSFIGETGVGASYEINDHLLVRGDVRYRYNHNFNASLLSTGTDEYHDMVVNLGFVVPLGDKAKPAKFEIPAPKPAVIPPPDCSTRDSDNDGVNDCLDKCPGTMLGSHIDVQGCPISLEIRGVQFELDSAELTPAAKTILDGVARNLIDYPQKNDLQVHGHTSSEASDAYNLKLSQRRSQSVVNYLKARGVSNKLYAKGYGESQPIADNNTETGRIRNRRVELVWMDK